MAGVQTNSCSVSQCLLSKKEAAVSAPGASDKLLEINSWTLTTKFDFY